MKLDDLVKDLFTSTQETMDELVSVDYDLYRQQYLGEWKSECTYTSDGNSGRWGTPSLTGITTDHEAIRNLPYQTDRTYATTAIYNYQPRELYPECPGEELGVVFIEGDEIKLMTMAGKSVTIGRLDDSEDFLPLEVIAAKKRLLEDPEPQQEA